MLINLNKSLYTKADDEAAGFRLPPSSHTFMFTFIANRKHFFKGCAQVFHQIKTNSKEDVRTNFCECLLQILWEGFPQGLVQFLIIPQMCLCVWCRARWPGSRSPLWLSPGFSAGQSSSCANPNPTPIHGFHKCKFRWGVIVCGGYPTFITYIFHQFWWAQSATTPPKRQKTPKKQGQFFIIILITTAELKMITNEEPALIITCVMQSLGVKKIKVTLSRITTSQSFKSSVLLILRGFH